MSLTTRRNPRRRKIGKGVYVNYDSKGHYSSTTEKSGDHTMTHTKSGVSINTWNDGNYSHVYRENRSPKPSKLRKTTSAGRFRTKNSGGALVDILVVASFRLFFFLIIAVGRVVGAVISQAAGAFRRRFLS